MAAVLPTCLLAGLAFLRRLAAESFASCLAARPLPQGGTRAPLLKRLKSLGRYTPKDARVVLGRLVRTAVGQKKVDDKLPARVAHVVVAKVRVVWLEHVDAATLQVQADVGRHRPASPRVARASPS